MKKLINRAFVYAIAGMAAGVFYREFTKWNGFNGRTVLAFVHPHLLTIGALLLLIAALFSCQLPLLEEKKFKTFYKLHTIGLPFMAAIMLVRGVLQVLGIQLSAGAVAALAGIAGISHIILGTSIIFLFLALSNAVTSQAKKQ